MAFILNLKNPELIGGKLNTFGFKLFFSEIDFESWSLELKLFQFKHDDLKIFITELMFQHKLNALEIIFRTLDGTLNQSQVLIQVRGFNFKISIQVIVF